MRPRDHRERARRDSPFLRKKNTVSRLRTNQEEQHQSWVDRPAPGSYLADQLREVSEVLSHIHQIQASGSFTNSSNLFRGYLNRASHELSDLCRLLTDRMRHSQDMEILEATAALVSELALAETDDKSMEELAATMESIQPTSSAVAAALATAKDLEVVADRSSLGYEDGKLVASLDMDIALAFDRQPPVEFTIRATQKIDFDSISLTRDNSGT